jgi:hypothetical protein
MLDEFHFGRLKSRQQRHEVRLRGLAGYARTLRVTATTENQDRAPGLHQPTPAPSPPRANPSLSNECRPRSPRRRTWCLCSPGFQSGDGNPPGAPHHATRIINRRAPSSDASHPPTRILSIMSSQSLDCAIRRPTHGFRRGSPRRRTSCRCCSDFSRPRGTGASSEIRLKRGRADVQGESFARMP